MLRMVSTQICSALLIVGVLSVAMPACTESGGTGATMGSSSGTGADQCKEFAPSQFTKICDVRDHWAQTIHCKRDPNCEMVFNNYYIGVDAAGCLAKASAYTDCVQASPRCEWSCRMSPGANFVHFDGPDCAAEADALMKCGETLPPL